MAISPSSGTPALLSILRRPENRERFLKRIEEEIKRCEAAEQVAEAETRFRSEQGERASYETEKAKCAADPVHWFNHWVWTFDPRLIGKIDPGTGKSQSPFVPFKLWPRQEEYVRWLVERIRKGEEGLTEKSRDAGVSYLCIGVAIWFWLFEPGFKATFGSRTEDLVDTRDDPDSLFEKARIILRRLPAWMMPTGFSWHAHDLVERLINPATGAIITGEGGDQLGRGGRSSVYIVDEAAFIAHAERVSAALSGTTDCIQWVSSANGMGNLFYRKRAALPPDRVFRFHWKDDPRKDDAWAAKKRASVDAAVFASEFDIDYAASVEGVVIPGAWVRSAQQLLRLVPDLPRAKLGVSGGDVGGGKAKSVVIHRFGPIVSAPERRQEGDTTGTAYWMLESCLHAGSKLLNFDTVGIGAGVASTLSGRTGKYTAIICRPVNTGVEPSIRVWPDERTSEEMFGNRKAELWWLARQALQRTHQHVLWLQKAEGGAKQRLDELIALPEDTSLASQLSIPKYFRNEKGKVTIETKQQLAKRGIPSPDEAEAFILTFEDDAPDETSGMVLDAEAFHRDNPFKVGR